MKERSESSHATLFSSGSWKAAGCFYDEEERPTKATGQTRVFHSAGNWYIKNYFLLADGRKIENTYQVDVSGQAAADWTASNSLFSNCKGKFLVLGDLILSTFSSADGQFTGLEILQKQNDSSYRNKGQLFLKRHKHSSWSFEFKKDQKSTEDDVN